MAEISAMFSWRGAGPAIMLDAYLVGSALAADYQFPPGEAGYNRAAAILWVGVSLFTFTIPASGLLVAKWLLSCCRCPYHNFLWLL